jgi:7-carboxy-7-deazaguanine synthase
MTQTNLTDTTLTIIETYLSVQGESTWAGLPCTFIRLARCNLRCRWCDTTYSFTGGDKITIAELLEKCSGYGCELVEITGGEPLAQEECSTLAQALIDEGYTVLVETSGSLPINVLPPETIKIMDLKCPDSEECEKNDWSNIDYLTDKDEVKFVLASRRDYEWARDVIRKHTLETHCRSILMSPVFGEIESAEIVQWILEDELPVRFQLQMHKFIWPPDQKGV